MIEPSFRVFLDTSLQVLEREAQRSYRALGERLGASSVRARIDGEPLTLRAGAGRVLAVEGSEPATSEFTSSRRAISAMLRAELTLLDAVLCNQVELTGPVDELVTLDACLKLYLHGAVRCPSFPKLLHEFLGKSNKVDPQRVLHGGALYRWQ